MYDEFMKYKGKNKMYIKEVDEKRKEVNGEGERKKFVQ